MGSRTRYEIWLTMWFAVRSHLSNHNHLVSKPECRGRTLYKERKLHYLFIWKFQLCIIDSA